MSAPVVITSVEKKDVTSEKVLDLGVPHYLAFVVATGFFLLMSIYVSVMFLMISKEFAANGSKTAGFVVVLVLLFSVLLIVVESVFLKSNHGNKERNLSMFYSMTIAFLMIGYGLCIYGYVMSYNDIFDDKNSGSDKLHYLKNNLITATILHTISMVLNFIVVIVLSFCAVKPTVSEATQV
jgi:hypothetical protein